MMKNTFKVWLKEDAVTTDGVTDLFNKFKSGISLGKQGHTDVVNKKLQKKQELDKQTMQNVIDHINKYVFNLFHEFPYEGGEGGPEDFLKKFDGRQEAIQAFNIFNNMAKSIEKMQRKFNDRLIKTKKVDKKQLDTFITRAKADAASGILDSKIENFVRSEANFFTELLTVKKNTADEFDKFTIDETEFAKRLSKRFSKTRTEDIQVVIEAMNSLLIYLEGEFTSYAKTIGAAGAKRPKTE